MRTKHAIVAMMKIGPQEIPTESINHSVNRKSRINNTLNTFFNNSIQIISLRLIVDTLKALCLYISSSSSLVAFIWLKYCRCGVKHYPINQSSSLAECPIRSVLSTPWRFLSYLHDMY